MCVAYTLHQITAKISVNLKELMEIVLKQYHIAYTFQTCAVGKLI